VVTTAAGLTAFFITALTDPLLSSGPPYLLFARANNGRCLTVQHVASTDTLNGVTQAVEQAIRMLHCMPAQTTADNIRPLNVTVDGARPAGRLGVYVYPYVGIT
jgi:hypothetical protein